MVDGRDEIKCTQTCASMLALTASRASSAYAASDTVGAPPWRPPLLQGGGDLVIA